MARITAPEGTTQERFQRALDLTRESGVRFRMNVRKCCRGCIEPKDLGLVDYEDTTPYGYTYGSQGFKVNWVNGEPFSNPHDSRRDPVRPEVIHVNHGNDSAERIKAAFEEAGFEVEWDGTSSCTVGIVIPKAA